MSVRAVTFDAGSTLIHWGAYTPHRLGAIYRAAGIDVTDADSVQATRACLRYRQDVAEPAGADDRDRWLREYNAVGLRAAGVEGDLGVLCDRVLEGVTRLAGRWVTDPDVPEVLDALRKMGLLLAVVSNWDGDLSERLASLGIRDYFGFIGDSALLGVSKPDPGIYHIACGALGVAPEDCVHVGDRPDTDVAVARAAGAVPVLYDPIDWWEADCHTVSRLRDLVPLVRDLMPPAETSGS